ncbi:LysR family transcriptional regulator [Aliidiomarina minuta]|uniref:LysR family transcriptional regulator n=1 Tax=Aliidiomarina minuta TaxID=880057 RepID=A0A432W764_9GAMM|nr:LysR family transcriptional regulator [Aliidiomarina minuta]RUO25915.1 LysR family transcriptional regulator [Aliidiomarina minuta]
MNTSHLNFNQLDLNLLRIFEAIYQYRQLSKAADKLALTPSAVSHALRRLRTFFDDPLFTRHGRVLVPTATCESLAPDLLASISSLRNLLSGAHTFEPGQSQQSFRISMPEALENNLLPAIAEASFRSAPHIKLESVAIDRTRLADRLSNRELDLAIDVALPLSEPVCHQPIFSDSFCVLGHNLPDTLDADFYLKSRHVAVSTRAKGLVVEDIGLLKQGMQRDVRVRCQNYHSAAALAQKNHFLLTAPTRLASILEQNFDLQVRPMPVKISAIQLHLYWHQQLEKDPATCWLREIVTNLYKDALQNREIRVKNNESDYSK